MARKAADAMDAAVVRLSKQGTDDARLLGLVLEQSEEIGPRATIAFGAMQADLQSGDWRELTPKQRAWLNDVADKLDIVEPAKNLMSSGKVPRGKEVELPPALTRLPLKPPGHRDYAEREACTEPPKPVKAPKPPVDPEAPLCPKCGGASARIHYGKLSASARKALGSTAVLGGCMVSPSSPKWCCIECRALHGDMAEDLREVLASARKPRRPRHG